MNRKQEKFFNLGTPELCSLRCVKQYVDQLSRFRVETTDAWKYVTAIDTFPGGGEVWSHRLGRYFRSEFEVHFAELMEVAWEWDVRYECHSIRVAKRKRYVPDFYVPDNNVWIEVKGMWHSGDKKKFKQAAEMLGEDRFILIGPYYQQELQGSIREIEDDERRMEQKIASRG